MLDGKPEEFITKELDPLAADFISAVKNARPQTSNGSKDLWRGQDWYAEEAVNEGLIDGIITIEDALNKAMQLIEQQKATALKIVSRNKLLNLIS